jgi:hypothetical protein
MLRRRLAPRQKQHQRQSDRASANGGKRAHLAKRAAASFGRDRSRDHPLNLAPAGPRSWVFATPLTPSSKPRSQNRGRFESCTRRALSCESARAEGRSPRRPPPANPGSHYRRLAREETSAPKKEHSSVAGRADECLATDPVMRARIAFTIQFVAKPSPARVRQTGVGRQRNRVRQPGPSGKR